MRRLLVAAAFLVAGVPAAACESPGAQYARLESQRFVLWMATRPAVAPIGREFAVDALLCAKGAAGADAVGFDAWMPAHRHGMNSRPSVKPLGGGRWRAEGYLFHMPGRWQFIFEIDTASGRERLTRDVDLD